MRSPSASPTLIQRTVDAAFPGNLFDASMYCEAGVAQGLAQSRVLVERNPLRPGNHDLRVAVDIELLRESRRTEEEPDSREESHGAYRTWATGFRHNPAPPPAVRQSARCRRRASTAARSSRVLMFANASGGSKRPCARRAVRAPATSADERHRPALRGPPAAPRPATARTAAGGRRSFRPSPRRPSACSIRRTYRSSGNSGASHGLTASARAPCSPAQINPDLHAGERARRRRPPRRRASAVRGLWRRLPPRFPRRTLIATLAQLVRSRSAAHASSGRPSSSATAFSPPKRTERPPASTRPPRADGSRRVALMTDTAGRACRRDRRSLRCRSRSANGSRRVRRPAVARDRDDVRIVGIEQRLADRAAMHLELRMTSPP